MSLLIITGIQRAIETGYLPEGLKPPPVASSRSIGGSQDGPGPPL